MSHLAWDDVAPGLSGRFRVIMPDLPGFGESEKPSPTRFSYSIEAFAEAIADLIAALGVGRCHVVGHGMSGAIALTLAADHREFVDRLILVDPCVYSLGRRNDLMTLPVLGAFFFKQLYGRSLFRNYFREKIFSPGFPLPTARVDAFYELFNSPSARESAFATNVALADLRCTEARLSRVKAPTFVIWGRSDLIQPAQLGQRLAREIGAERLEVMDTGHAPHMERPDAFLRNVRAFLSRPRSNG
jgi:pimeloyl-ACP methyl ester carboxylesterase